MDICKLCLLEDVDTLEDEKEILNAKDLQHIQTLIPQLNSFYLTNSIICSVCTKDVKVIAKFMHSIKQTEHRIESTLIKENSDKLDIKSLHQKVNALPINLKEHVAVCRLCLSFIAKPHIFLYDSKINVLHHELLISMFESCNINLNLSVSENPSLCTDCWENLQISFRFKKCFLEVEKKILFYCTKYNLRREDIDKKLLGRMYSYFLKYNYNHLSQLKNKGKIKIKGHSNDIVMEHNYVNKVTNKRSSDNRKPHALLKYIFTDEEDEVLIAAYLFITKNEQYFYHGYFEQILAIWKEFYLEKNLPKYAIYNRLKALKKNKDYKDLFETTKCEVAKVLDNSSDEEIIPLSNDISNRLGSNEIPNLTGSKVGVINQLSSPNRKVNIIQRKLALAKPRLKTQQLSIKLEQIIPSVMKAKLDQSTKVVSKMKEQSFASKRDIRQPKTQVITKLKNDESNKIVIHSVQNFRTTNTNKPSSPRSNSLILKKLNSVEVESLFHSTHTAIQNGPMETYLLTTKQSETTNLNNTPNKQTVKSEITELESNINTVLPNNTKSNKNEKLTHLVHNSYFVPENRENNSEDSDDSFIDGGDCSSIIQDIKEEPFDGSDIEIVEEPKIEMESYFSDSDKSLPELERMDIFSLDDKRNFLNSINDHDPNLNVEEVNTCRRYVFRNQPKSTGQFKCLECNFETKYRRGAAIHSEWHKKTSTKKIHECPECPYKISNKWLLKKHMKLHKEENEIPTLLPWT